MAVSDISTLSKNLAEGTFSPVYLFTGEDVYRKNAILAKIIAKVGADEFNVTKEDAAKTDFGEIIALANTAPVFSVNRIIFLNNIDKLKKPQAAALIEYLELPLQSTILVLFHNDAKKLKTDATVKKAAEAVGMVIDFPELKGAGLSTWINNKLKEKNLKPDMEVSELLAETVGGDLSALEQEVEKLSLYKGEGGEVCAADVLACVGFSKEENPFALSNAILNCDRKTAITLAGKLLEEGESPVSVLSKVAQCVLKMTRIKRLVNAGYSSQEIVSKAGLMFWESRLVASARIFPSEAVLLKTLNKVIDADMQFKSSSGVDPQVTIKGILLTMFSK
ncbi:DNA polymerase-3 subunit delta [Elusimicrobium simillimum]|uniref:DNA polymerase III subunit delta n=1 Tax=Elusimicrobium simillimum TaxID=3143438 RepID=UPI003C701468